MHWPAGGCDFVTSGGCIVATPGMYGAGATAGAVIGGAIGYGVGAATDHMIGGAHASRGPSAVFSKPPVDAHDASGAKAPGKPTENDGFVDPKDDEKWVKNPNGKGSGWLDKNGNVWVPTGWGAPAHGGPHWDVQHPDGSHTNVYPGGRQR